MRDLKDKVQRHLQKKADREFDYTSHTRARIGIGHSGGHLRMDDWLHLQSSFAHAKDAVFESFDVAAVSRICQQLNLQAIEVNSQATDHMQFLLRPDLGRLVADTCKSKVTDIFHANGKQTSDILVVVSGGLSPNAIKVQIPSFLPAFVNLAQENNFSLSPIIINPRGRVALGDHLNEIFKAKLVVMLIGERPGLTVSDSLGIYFTYNARIGCTDEQRNCISNIHSDGLSCEDAASKLLYLARKSIKIKLTGIELKDDQTQCLTI